DMFTPLIGTLKKAKRRSSPRRRFVPHLEILEGRSVPSTFSVLNLADSGKGSLRQAVLDAQANPGADEIEFAAGLTGAIYLTTGQLSITGDLAINGQGAELLAVSGSNQSRVFNISGGATVTIEGLTIRDGKAIGAVGAPALGGGILNTSS